MYNVYTHEFHTHMSLLCNEYAGIWVVRGIRILRIGLYNYKQGGTYKLQTEHYHGSSHRDNTVMYQPQSYTASFR